MASKKTTTMGMGCDDDWKVESDLRTLIEAEQIEKDPKRMAAVKEMAKKRLLEVAAIAGGADAD